MFSDYIIGISAVHYVHAVENMCIFTNRVFSYLAFS